MTIEIINEEYLLTPEKILVHHKSKTGFLADLHLGKSTHFRKSGIAIPKEIVHDELFKLSNLIERHHLKNVYFLGDLFHSDLNNEWLYFESFLKKHSEVNFILVKGNHDILPSKIYQESLIEVVDEPFRLQNLVLTHHPLTKDDLIAIGDSYNLSGHIHPGVTLKGKGKNNLTLPCYYQFRNQLILPAFGRFTGLAKMQTALKQVKYYPIASSKVLCINN